MQEIQAKYNAKFESFTPKHQTQHVQQHVVFNDVKLFIDQSISYILYLYMWSHQGSPRIGSRNIVLQGQIIEGYLFNT